jgi:hypothetical protein
VLFFLALTVFAIVRIVLRQRDDTRRMRQATPAASEA